MVHSLSCHQTLSMPYVALDCVTETWQCYYETDSGLQIQLFCGYWSKPATSRLFYSCKVTMLMVFFLSEHAVGTDLKCADWHTVRLTFLLQYSKITFLKITNVNLVIVFLSNLVCLVTTKAISSCLLCVIVCSPFGSLVLLPVSTTNASHWALVC